MNGDGITLNSMAHPETNSPEPSYEIDSNKIETIEVDIKMNAYELAQYLETAFYADEDIEKATNMLRQQADRIAELEKQLWMTEVDVQQQTLKHIIK
jgi:hypothetical protein